MNKLKDFLEEWQLYIAIGIVAVIAVVALGLVITKDQPVVIDTTELETRISQLEKTQSQIVDELAVDDGGAVIPVKAIAGYIYEQIKNQNATTTE